MIGACRLYLDGKPTDLFTWRSNAIKVIDTPTGTVYSVGKYQLLDQEPDLVEHYDRYQFVYKPPERKINYLLEIMCK